MKSIGILGVGQAGGNIAEVAANMGFQTALINTNQRDGFINKGVEKKYFVPGYNGAGQDRSLGKKAIYDNAQDIVSFVKDSFKNTKLLLVAFSTDGGTGSGMSPRLIELLLEQLPGLHVGAMAILPERNVSAGNRINIAECVVELSNLEGISSIFLVDNDQVRRFNQNSSKQQIYHSSNHQAMTAINHVLELTEESSLYGNFDETDFLNILHTRGVTIIATADVSNCRTAAEVVEKIQNSWETSVFTPVETSSSVIRAGLIFEGSENISRLIDIPSIFEKIGEPLQLFEGTYISSSDSKITTILAGLPFPNSRLYALEHFVEKNKDRLEKLITKEFTQNYETTLSWAMFKKPKPKKVEPLSTKSKLQK